MRNVVATLYIAALFQCVKGSAYTCLNVVYRVVPSGLACDF